MKINTKSGPVEAGGVEVRFTNPTWLSNYRFVAHRVYLDGRFSDDEWRLSEATTGYGIKRTIADSWVKSAMMGKERLIANEDTFKAMMEVTPKLPNP